MAGLNSESLSNTLLKSEDLMEIKNQEHLIRPHEVNSLPHADDDDSDNEDSDDDDDSSDDDDEVRTTSKWSLY